MYNLREQATCLSRQEYRSKEYGRRWGSACLPWQGYSYLTNIFDHSKAVDDLLRAGVDCYMSRGTAEVMGWDGHHRCNMFHRTSDGGYRVVDIAAQWVVMPFPLEHDAEEPTGFLIEPYEEDKRDERLLFIPDTEMIKNRFKNVTILAIEANHEAGILSDNIANGKVPAFLGRRIRRNHLSLSVVKDFILVNEMQKTLREIHLIHLSNSNSDEARFRREIQGLVGIPVYIAGE